MEFSKEFWLAVATIAPLLLIAQIVSLSWFATRYKSAARRLFHPGPGAPSVLRRLRAAIPAIVGFVLAIWVSITLAQATAHGLTSLREGADAADPASDQRHLVVALILIIAQAGLTAAGDATAPADASQSQPSGPNGAPRDEPPTPLDEMGLDPRR